MGIFTQSQRDCCTDNGYDVVEYTDVNGDVYGTDCISPDGNGDVDEASVVINPWDGTPAGSDGDPCIYFGEEDSGNPFNWDGLNSLLSTLGGIAVPFLPFLFGDDQTNPNFASNPDLARAEAERRQGQKLVVGFVILIALSVGVYMLMKRKK